MSRYSPQNWRNLKSGKNRRKLGFVIAEAKIEILASKKILVLPILFSNFISRLKIHKMVNHFSYQSNHGYHSNQVMYSSNRSRTESGSSESSRGSGNSGPTRRRSHRPRGCRGGTNRRKQNNGEGKKKPHYNNKTYNHDFKNRVQGKFSRPPMEHPGPLEEEFLVNTGQQLCDPNSFRRSSYNNNARKDLNHRLPDYPYNPSGISVSTRTEFHHAGSVSTSRNSQYYRDNSTVYNGEPENDYPLLLQSSSSDTSSSNETIFEQHDVAYNQNQYDVGHGQILPPLPSDALVHPLKQTPFGPNPYALKTSGYGSKISTLQHTNNSFTTPSVIGRSVTRPQSTSLDTAIHHLPSILQPSHKHMDFDYRAQRLEKQRQNVVGGSLFATSPRSFLMSCKNSFNE